MQTFAYFDSGHEFPEEIVMAAGFIPRKILGDVEIGTGPADEYLHNYFCPFARACFTEALTKAEKEWAGIGFAHGCDATNRHYDVWRAHLEIPFFWVNTPMKIDAAARQFQLRELENFRAGLERAYELEISDEKLAAAIRLSNRIKEKLRELGALRAKHDISNLEYLETIREVLAAPRPEAPEKLDRTLAEWRRRPPFPRALEPILLTGSDVTSTEWMAALEEAGLRVVRDDLSLGERYYRAAIPEGIPPLKALVEYYGTYPQPATRVPSDLRLAYLEKALWENDLRLVVSQNLKFCEPYAIDAVWTTKRLKEKGFQVIHLEREYTPTLDQQVITRLETFKEMACQ
jgi:benzoyl-CoA reductase/2-hydroxyglutaryl-CoA dehydratase subunit BcrC/BadD/HgdB